MKYVLAAFLFVYCNEILSLFALLLMSVFFCYDLLRARFGDD